MGRVFPTPDEIDETAEKLVTRYGVSPQLLGQLIGKEKRDQLSRLLRSLGGSPLTPTAVAKLWIRRQGASIFSGSSEAVRKLRHHLLSRLTDEQTTELFKRFQPRAKSRVSSITHMRTPLAEKKMDGWFEVALCFRGSARASRDICRTGQSRKV